MSIQEPEQNHINQSDSKIESPIQPEKKNLTDRQKQIIITASGLVITLSIGLMGGIVGGNIAKAHDNPQPTVEEPAATPEIKVPKEAEAFVEAFQGRYEDPVSTYFANKEVNTALSDSYASLYKIRSELSDTNKDRPILGFESYNLNIKAPDDIDTAEKVFNEYVAPMLSLYMNGIARNESGKPAEIINSEFQNYCSITDPNNPYKERDDIRINDLMNLAQSIVAKYGSAANYSIVEIGDDNNHSSFYLENIGINPTVNYDANTNKTTESLNDLKCGNLTFVINIDQFNGNKVTSTLERVSVNELSIMRNYNIETDTNSKLKSTKISIGIIK